MRADAWLHWFDLYLAKQLRILLACSSLGGGGAERAAVNLGSEFCERGDQVTFFYWDEQSNQRYPIHTRARLRKSFSRNLLVRIFCLRKILNAESIDVVFGFADMANIVCWGALLGRRRMPAFVASIHSNLPERDAHAGISLKNRLLRRAHKRACMRATRVVVVSDGAREALIDYYGLPPDNTVRIYNPVIESVSSNTRKSEFKLPLRLVTAGRLTQAKNYPIMIRAVKLLAEKYNTPCRLVIYGEGDCRSQIQKYIDSHGVSSFVEMHGFVSDLAAKLTAHDIFLMSSAWEGFGNVLVEALNCGLHVISTDCPSGPREILDGGKYGILVPSGDSDAMARAILATSREPRAFRHAELRQHLEQFTLSHVADEYTDIVRSLSV